MSDLLGTRAEGRTDPLSATTKVADRVHIASKGLPEYWTRTDRWYNFTSNVRGFSHVLATVDENTYTGGLDGFDHPIAWCKDYQGGRSFYTGAGGTGESFSDANVQRQLAGALDWAAGMANADVQRLRRHGAGQLPADQDLGSAEHQRADRHRPAAGRPHPPDRA